VTRLDVKFDIMNQETEFYKEGDVALKQAFPLEDQDKLRTYIDVIIQCKPGKDVMKDKLVELMLLTLISPDTSVLSIAQNYADEDENLASLCEVKRLILTGFLTEDSETVAYTLA